MKRILSIFMIVAMLASVAAVNVSAAGQVYMQDSFDELDPNRWCTDVSNFYVEDGWLVGDNTAVVHQTMYGVEPDDDSGRINMTWSECYVSVDIRLTDYSDDQDDYGAALWWKDYQLAPGEEWYEGFEYGKGAIYTLEVQTESDRVALWGNYDELEETTAEYTGTDTTAAEVEEEEVPLMEVAFPDGTFAPSFIDPPVVNLGMEITSTGISAFLNGKYLFTWNSPTLLGQNQVSPVLLVNDGLLVGFDNFTVASLDWDGIPAKDVPVPAPGTTDAVTGGEQGNNVNPAPQPPETREEVVTKTVVVTDTDAEGNVVTREEVVTEKVIVTVPAADTNTGGTAGGTSTSTGDMAVIVIAVMIVSLGAAIVVKKVNIK